MRKFTRLHIIGILRYMFNIMIVLHEVGPSRPDFWIVELAVPELEVEVCIDGEEK